MIYESSVWKQTFIHPIIASSQDSLSCYRDNFSIYQSKIMTICLALLIIFTHPAPSQYSISKCSPFLYSSLVIICTLYCTTINIGPNWFIPYYSPLPPSEQRSSAFNISLFMFNKLLFWYRTRVLHKLFTSFACPTHISSFTTINYSFTDIQESYQEQIRLDKWNNKSIKGIAMMSLIN